jgi:hypothetical protein
MNKTIKLFGTLTIIALFFLTACAPTKLTAVYKDSSYTGGSLESVLVVGVAENLRNRKMFEQFFAEQFQNNGVKAFSSADSIPSDKELNKETIKGLAEKLGADAVLVTHLVGVDEKEEYIPPAYTNVPSPHHHALGPYYSGVYGYVHNPGYYVTHEYVRLENNLYETKTEKLIWSSSSETINPASVNETIESLCKVVMKSLRDHQLIK